MQQSPQPGGRADADSGPELDPTPLPAVGGGPRPPRSLAMVLGLAAVVAGVWLALTLSGLLPGDRAGVGAASPEPSNSFATAQATPTDPPSPTSPPTSLPTSPPATPEPTIPPRPDWMDRTPSPECVNPPPDLMAVIFNSERLACYGAGELTLEGTVGQIGAYDPYLGCKPEWLCHPYWNLHAIIEQAQVAPTIVLAATSHGSLAWTGEWPTPDLWVVVHPQSGITDAELLALVTGSPDTEVTEAHPVPVRVTGHFDDPAASTCAYTGDYTDIGLAPEDAARGCRNTFVVTSIAPLAE